MAHSETFKTELREKMRTMLTQCTEAQQNIFCRMYGSVDEVSDEKLDWAFYQIENSLKKNHAANNPS